MVYPSAVGRKWPYHRGDSAFDNEKDYLDSTVSTVIREYNVDTSKLYVVGLSGGGFFLSRWIMLSRWRFDGAGFVGSTPTKRYNYEEYINQSHVSKWMIAIGTEDALYNGTRFTYSVDQVISGICENQNLDTLPIIYYPDRCLSDSSHIVETQYRNDSFGLSIVKVINGGHHWPGSKFNADHFVKNSLGNFNKDTNVAPILLEFLLEDH